MLVWVNPHCLFWLSSFRISVLVVLTMLFTVEEHALSFNFSFAQHQHQLPHCCYLFTLFPFWNPYHNTYQKSDLYHGFCEFHMCFLCEILTLASESSSQWCLWLWETHRFIYCVCYFCKMCLCCCHCIIIFVIWRSQLSAYFCWFYTLLCHHNTVDPLFSWFFDCAHLFLLSLMQQSHCCSVWPQMQSGEECSMRPVFQEP